MDCIQWSSFDFLDRIPYGIYAVCAHVGSVNHVVILCKDGRVQVNQWLVITYYVRNDEIDYQKRFLTFDSAVIHFSTFLFGER